ncbi:MAG: S-layer homology domain-containing protein [Clostridiaceae bacterium]
MRKITWRLGSLIMVMVLLLSAFPMTVRAVGEVWIDISSAAGLISVGSNLSGNYRLTADIDLAGAEWKPIGPFSGKLDGNSKVIRNFTINDTSVSNKGLFSSIAASGQISNLGIENANITAGSNAGILAGTNSGIISRSYTKGSVNGYEYVGGLVGQNSGTIENSFTRASVSGKDYLGGLAGANSVSGIVKTSYASSSCSPSVFNNYLEFNGTPVGNYSSPNSGGYIAINHKDIYVGEKFTLEAWFQWDDTNTDDCNFIMGKGYEQFEIHTGGGSGVNGLRFIPVWNEGGDSWIDIKNVIRPGWFHVAAVYEYNTIEKQAMARVYVNGEAQDLWRGSVNLGKVATLSRTFNTLGYDKSSGTYVKKDSPINIGRRTDGWFYFDGKISDVRFWNIARTGEDIKRDKDRVLNGNETGLVGYWKLNEASGDAIDSSTTHNNGTLAGDVVRTSETAATHKGGLIGQNTGTVSGSYYDSGVSGQSDAVGTSKSTADMKLQSTFTGWDFNNIWGLNSGINSGYPYLLSEIRTASVTMTAPAAGAIPQTAAQVETATGSEDYTVSNVAWNGELTPQGKFKADQVYTANVTLTSKNGGVFQTGAFTPVVAGSASVGATATSGTGVGNTVTFTVTFSATAAKTVTDIQIKNQPADLLYTEGESLNLAGLEVTLTYNDGSTADVVPAVFSANGITASPANGAVLTVAAHNGHAVTLTCNGYNAITNNLTVNADTRTITGYYTSNDGSDTALTTMATVPYGATEAAAKAGLSASGYAKLSDNSYVAVTIAWAFDTAYDGNDSGVKAVTGTVTGTFTGGQVPVNRTGTVTVEAAPTYTTAAIGNQTMTAKTAGYGSGTQETKTITVTKTGTGDLANLAVSLNGGGSSNFVVTQPPVTVLNSGTPSTTFTVKAKDGLAAGTYTETVTVSADNMTNVTFTVTQVVNLSVPVIQTVAAGDAHIAITWNSVPGAAAYKIFSTTTAGLYVTALETVGSSVYSYDATGLTNGTTYYFVVKAANGEGDSNNSNEVSATPQVAAPGVPVLQSASAGDGYVNVSWSGVAGSTGYKVYASTAAGVYYVPATTVAGEVYSCDVTGLANGTTYYFVVKATNPGGESAYSNEISAMPKTVPGAPTNVTAAAGDGEAAVSFAAPADDGGSPITGYVVTSNPDNITAVGTGTTITVTGLTNGTTYTFTVKAANEAGNGPESAASNAVTPYRPSNNEDSEDDPAPMPTLTTPGEGRVEILVNGKTETAATATTTKVDDKTVTTIVVDDKKVGEKLQKEGNNAVVTIPVKNNADVIIGTLNGQTVKNMETVEAVVEVKTENVTYTLPASQINIDAVLEQIGEQVELKDIAVNVKISEPAADTVKIVEDTADKNNYQIMVKPIEFEITCSSGNKTVEISKFNAYVERLVAIPEGVDPSRITTGIVLNSDGTFSHVPTVITIIDGKYYAKINSLTNSTYSVIWSPKTFKDVRKHWAKDAVSDMGSRLVISCVGNDMFEPDSDITRGEFAAIVVKALGLMRPGTGKASFGDVSKNDSYYDAVSIAYENGIISGYGNGKFGPNDKITREQAMIIIARAMKITGLKPELKDSEVSLLLANYADGADTSTYAKTSVAECLKTSVITGRTGSAIAPGDYITRAETAVIVQRLLQKSNLI